jgi:UDP-N-acetylmuramoyl-tripeptide--D-alanyl-D-alanine ligase
MKYFWTRYLLSYPKVILYMLQGSEYKISDYLRWLHRTSDFRKVMQRRPLVWTIKTRLLAVAEAGIVAGCIIAAWILTGIWIPLGWILILAIPFLLAYILIIPLAVGQVLVQRPREKVIISHATTELKKHRAKKIAVVGSYGKTTTKEVLKTVLAEKYVVAATPGNMNTLIGTSRFIATLKGNEDILLFEMGESHIGDIDDLCRLVEPDMGVITGINQAHLESFGSIDNTVKTIFELQDYLGEKLLYKNKDSELVRGGVKDTDSLAYDSDGVDGWRVTHSSSDLTGTEIVVVKSDKKIKAKVQLIGEHLIGTMVLAIAIADQFGLKPNEIEQGLASIRPFNHRMQPRVVHGATIIDDTYNGNIQGMEAGLQLLKDSGAKRRVYVTPGLVEQGEATAEVHEKLGRLIAKSADTVVLMNNSVTSYITIAMKQANFAGELLIVDNPLEFYTNLEHFVAAGDVILMQNDWTDNYS